MFKINKRHSDKKIFSFLASFYKPLGLLNPFVFCVKVLLQKVCVQKLSWEVSLFGNLLTERKVIFRHLKGCESVKLLRWYRDYCNLDEKKLHDFVDANLKGYGCCV